MGTSRNDASPDTPAWKPALRVLGDPKIPSERQCLELWRAAESDRGENFLRDFSNPAIAEACRYVSKGLDVKEALRNFDNVSLREGASGIVVDMARRALARCTATKSEPLSFVSEVFSEAISYYASRDLPSFVGARGRVSSMSDSIQLKRTLRDITRLRVREAGQPKLQHKAWKKYISKVIHHLTGTEVKS